MAEKPLKDYVFEEMAFAFSGRMMDQVVIQVLERTPTIAYFGDSRAALRGGLFVFEQTGAVGILLSVGEVVRYVYASWLDFQRDSDRRVLHLLENQDCLMVRFFGSNFQQVRIFVVENTLRDWLATARAPARRDAAMDSIAFCGGGVADGDLLRARRYLVEGAGARMPHYRTR